MRQWKEFAGSKLPSLRIFSTLAGRTSPLLSLLKDWGKEWCDYFVKMPCINAVFVFSKVLSWVPTPDAVTMCRPCHCHTSHSPEQEHFCSSPQFLLHFFFLFCFFLFLFLFATLHHSHSNSGSEPNLRPTPQLTATPDPKPTEWGQDWTRILMILVGSVSHWATKGTPLALFFNKNSLQCLLPSPNQKRSRLNWKRIHYGCRNTIFIKSIIHF